MSIACCIHDMDVSRCVQEVLVREGYDCEEFLSETSLLRTMKNRNFELIVTDGGTEIDLEERQFSFFHLSTLTRTPVFVMLDARSPEGVAYLLSQRLQNNF